MFTKAIIFFVLVIGAMLMLYRALGDGSALTFLNAHPQLFAAKLEYDIGEGYYTVQNFDQARRYFNSVVAHFPSAKIADDAAFGIIQCEEDTPGVGRTELIPAYQQYLERYPDGNNVALAKNRIDYYQSGAR